MGILLCEQNFRDVWGRNKSVRAEIGQILHTHTHTHTHTRGYISSRDYQHCFIIVEVGGILFQVRFQPNDHQTIKDIADEIKIFEGISHPSLVKYYGIEVHRVGQEFITQNTSSDNLYLSYLRVELINFLPKN